MAGRRVIAGAVAGLLALAGWGGAATAADTYAVDTVHSAVLFKVKHMGVSNSYGRFNDISGSISVDEQDPAKGSVEIVVKADSVDTANAKRDQHLKSPDFLNVKQFPVITFKSTKVGKGAEADTYEVTGDFSLHGVTKPVTLKVVKTGAGKGMKGEALIGLEATFTIKRSEYGMSYGIPGVSDEVHLTVSVEAGKP